MNQQTMIDTLTKARELIKIGWIKGQWARNKAGKAVDPWSEDACEFCTEGAILAVTHFDPEDKQLADAAIRILQAANPEFSDIKTLTMINLGKTGSSSLISKASAVPARNDNHKTTHGQVVRMFDNAIKLAQGMKWHNN